MKTILAIDPGTFESAYVVLRGRVIEEHGFVSNDVLLDRLSVIDADVLTIEMVASYGMPVGESTFETCVWIGRFIERWPGPWMQVYRKKRKQIESVTMYLCQTTRAKDPQVRQAVIDQFPATGGGKVPQIGTQKKPGPLYGLKSHEFQALAVALTYQGCRDADDDTGSTASGK